MFKKILLPVVIASALSLNLTGCSTGVVTDAVPDMSQEALRAEALRLTEKGDFALARDYLEALDSRYPFGELTDQVQLDLIYAYYKSHKSEQATAAIERFLRLNPNSMYTDYALYMKGLNELQKHGTIIQDYLGFDRSQKDPVALYDAFKAFTDLIERFPNSPYAKDAYLRLVDVKMALARREWAIAKYYQDRGALVSAIRHCHFIIYNYPDSMYTKAAYEMMAQNYETLGLPVPAANVRKVIAASHFDPDSI